VIDKVAIFVCARLRALGFPVAMWRLDLNSFAHCCSGQAMNNVVSVAEILSSSG
jgi:hypothetical protein